MGSWPLITGGKSAAFMEGGQVQALGSFGDTASHLPDCCSFIRIGVGCGRALSTAPPQRKPLSVSDILPGQASHLATNDPEREKPLIIPGLYTLTKFVAVKDVWVPK